MAASAQVHALRTSAEVLELLLAESARRFPEPPRAPAASEPIVVAAAPWPETAPASKADAARPLRVLLAEDHPVNRKVVELILGSIGADMTCVENGALAVEAFRTRRFDVILMDMQMPVMDGLTAIRQIRGIEAASGAARTPILSLTANAMPEHVDASFAAGADDHLTKPISAPGLIATIEAVTAAPPADAPERRRSAA